MALFDQWSESYTGGYLLCRTIGIVLGLLVAVVRSTYAKTGKMKIGSFLCGIYITVIRGTPVVVQLLIIYFVVFCSVKIDKVLVAIMAFGLNSGAYVAGDLPFRHLCPLTTGSLKLEEALASVMEKPCFISSCRRYSKCTSGTWKRVYRSLKRDLRCRLYCSGGSDEGRRYHQKPYFQCIFPAAHSSADLSYHGDDLHQTGVGILKGRLRNSDH